MEVEAPSGMSLALTLHTAEAEQRERSLRGSSWYLRKLALRFRSGEANLSRARFGQH